MDISIKWFKQPQKQHLHPMPSLKGHPPGTIHLYLKPTLPQPPMVGQVLSQVRTQTTSMLISKTQSNHIIMSRGFYSAPITASENFDTGLSSSESWLMYKQVWQVAFLLPLLGWAWGFVPIFFSWHSVLDLNCICGCIAVKCITAYDSRCKGHICKLTHHWQKSSLSSFVGGEMRHRFLVWFISWGNFYSLHLFQSSFSQRVAKWLIQNPCLTQTGRKMQILL